jgi:hypothetical protein
VTRNGQHHPTRPRIELGGGSASPEEAAAIAAAIAPAPVTGERRPNRWLRAGLYEATGRTGGPSAWGDRERWGA